MSTINGGTSNDNITGSIGSDLLNGGAGSDTVNGGLGNDTLVYRLSENNGAKDQYNGGSGSDIVRLELTQAEWASASVQAQLTRYANYQDSVINLPILGQLFPSDFTFDFGNGTTLTISSVETLEVLVDGQATNLDKPVITTTNAGGTVYEDGNTDNNPATSQSATGTIQFFDFDDSDNHVVSVTAPAGAVGALTASLTDLSRGDGQGAVTWTYNLTNNAAVQSLGVNQTRTEVFNVRIADANNAGQYADSLVTITIRGSNDAPTVSGALTSSRTEGASAYTLNLLAGASDIDQGESATLSVANVMYAVNGGAASASVPGGLSRTNGSLSVNPGDAAFNSLAVGQQRTIVVSYTVVDAQGATVAQTQTITVTGTNDAPTVAAALNSSTTEGAAAYTLNLLAGAADPDAGETATLSVANVTYAVNGAAASATLPAGLSRTNGSLSVNPGDATFNSLAVGQQRTVVVSYNVVDAQGAALAQTQTITVVGTNDAPTVSAALSSQSTEGDATYALDLLAGASDIDQGETATLGIGNLSYAIDGGASTAGIPQGLILNGSTLTIDPSDAAFASLNDGEQATIVLSYNVVDAQGATVAQTQTIVIAGTGTAHVNSGPQIRMPTSLGNQAILVRGEAGVHQNDETYLTFANAGDVNGDGIGDLVVGEFTHLGDSPVVTGAAYVVFGGAGTDTIDLAKIAQGFGGFKMIGQANDRNFGASVASGGDINGDGLDDLIVGLPQDGPLLSGISLTDATSAGAYVVFGKTDGAEVDMTDVVNGSGQGFAITKPFQTIGQQSLDEISFTAESLGDINGDGLADLVLGSNQSNGLLNAYVVYGKADGSTVNLLNWTPGQDGFQITGDGTMNEYRPVANAGDINGDGINDILVGGEGGAYLIYGGSDPTSVSLADIEAGQGGFAIVGGTSPNPTNGGTFAAHAGWSVSGLGDVNGDGIDDFAVGAYEDSNLAPLGGAAYVVFGQQGLGTVNLADITAGQGGFKITGDEFLATLGITVQEAGDVNGDGLNDVILSGLGGFSSESTVVFGKADGQEVRLSDVRSGQGGFLIKSRESAIFNLYSAGVGDWNGDGLADLAVGPVDKPIPDRGRGFIVFGKQDGSIVDTTTGSAVGRDNVPLVFTTALGTPIAISDVDDDVQHVTLSVGHGTLSLGQVQGLSFLQGAGTADASLSFSGSLDNVNAALASLSYLANTGYVGGETLHVQTSDGQASIAKDMSFKVEPSLYDAPIIVFHADQPNYTPDGQPVTIATMTIDNAVAGHDIDYSIAFDQTLSGSGLSFAVNGDQLVMSGMPEASVLNYHSLGVTATDSISGLQRTSWFSVILGTPGGNNIDPGNIHYGNNQQYADGDGSMVVYTLGSEPPAHDLVDGSHGNDTLYGGLGTDVLYGNEGRDLLVGGAGDDSLMGGLSADTLIGGAGADHFVFEIYPLPGQPGSDLIADFNPDNQDVIELWASNFDALASEDVTLSADYFAANVGGNAFDANDYILYDTATGNLFYDADGIGADANKILFATLTTSSGTAPVFNASNSSAFNAGDFVIQPIG